MENKVKQAGPINLLHVMPYLSFFRRVFFLSRNQDKFKSVFWFNSFQLDSFCEFLGDAIFPSTFFKKTDFSNTEIFPMVVYTVHCGK